MYQLAWCRILAVDAQDENWLELEVRNPLRNGESLEYLGKDIKAIPFEVKELLDQDGIPL